jgi:hypothetical protein
MVGVGSDMRYGCYPWFVLSLVLRKERMEGPAYSLMVFHRHLDGSPHFFSREKRSVVIDSGAISLRCFAFRTEDAMSTSVRLD